MALNYKKLGQQVQALFDKRGEKPDWDIIRRALLQAGAHWLWNQQKRHQQPLPALLNPSIATDLNSELAPACAELFQGKPVWAQLQVLAGLAEQAAPPEVRKASGMYYTPPEVSDFVVSTALKYWQPQSPATFLDPACGSGLFLWGVIAILTDPEPDPKIVAAWINSAHGSDTDALALQVTDFGFRLYWQRRFPDLQPPTARLQQLDALSALEQGLQLNVIFPDLTALGLIISNPPYVGERSHKELFTTLKTGYWAEHYRGRGDLYYYFFHLALALAQPETVCALLTPNYFLTATAAQYLRSRLRDQTQLLELINFGELRLFPSAHGHHSQLTLFRPGKSDATVSVSVKRAENKGLVSVQDLETLSRTEGQQLPQQSLFQGPELMLGRQSDDLPLEAEFTRMMASGSVIGDHFIVRQGIVSGADRLSPRLREWYSLDIVAGTGIFVLTEPEYQALLSPETASWLKPWFKNSDITPLQPNLNNRSWLIYIHRNAGEPPKAILEHLERFRPVLEARREVQLGRIPWYQLQWPREPEMFTAPKILLPQRARKGIAAYTHMPWFASADVYYILAKPGSPWTLEQLLPLLNSELYTQWWSHRGKRKGGLIELYYQPLISTPLPKI